MVQKEVQELKEISKIIDNGLYNIALAKAVRGEAYIWVMHRERIWLM